MPPPSPKLCHELIHNELTACLQEHLNFPSDNQPSPAASLSPDSEELQKGGAQLSSPHSEGSSRLCKEGHTISTTDILHKMSHTRGIWENIFVCIARLAYKGRI